MPSCGSFLRLLQKVRNLLKGSYPSQDEVCEVVNVPTSNIQVVPFEKSQKEMAVSQK